VKSDDPYSFFGQEEASRMRELFDGLPAREVWKPTQLRAWTRPVFITTVDDYVTRYMVNWYLAKRIPVTYFLLMFGVADDYAWSLRDFSEWVRNLPPEDRALVDVQIHIDKQDEHSAEQQIRKFHNLFECYPTCCRLHRLLVRELGLDLLWLHSLGIKLDSSVCQLSNPYLYPMEGREIPVFEVPITVVDCPVHMARSLTCARSVTQDVGGLLRSVMDRTNERLTGEFGRFNTVTALFHPQAASLSAWNSLPLLARGMGFSLMNMSQIHQSLVSLGAVPGEREGDDADADTEHSGSA
jgi:hypothetical protein